MRNLLVYPLYKIEGRETEYEKHKLNLEKNIEIVKKFNCVDEIKVVGSEVNHWSEMVVDMIEQIYNLNTSGCNVLFSEIDAVFLSEFSEIFSLEKMTMFARCNGASKIDPSLSAGYYLNSGIVYYPANLNDSMWYLARNKLKDSSSVAIAGTTYEALVNKMFYSQFSDMKSGIDYIKKTVGFSKYNWRGLLSVDHSEMPSTIENIKHIHFLNMSEYIHNVKNLGQFWYNEFLHNFYTGVIDEDKNKIKENVIDLLDHYKNNVNLNSIKTSNIENYIKILKGS